MVTPRFLATCWIVCQWAYFSDARSTAKVEGFQYCNHLNGAVFRVDVKVGVDKHARTLPLSTLHMVRLVDEAAQHVFNSKISHYLIGPLKDFYKPHSLTQRRPIDQRAAFRMACYMAADGHNAWVDVAQERLLVSVDGPRYFPELGYGLPSSPKLPQSFSTAAPHYSRQSSNTAPPVCKLGYVLLVHQSLEATLNLVSAIHRPNYSIVLIHVDAKNAELKQQLQTFFETHRRQHVNVFVMKRSFAIYWGHSSMVMAQQAALFEMQDKGPCEFYINLSGFDYPLASPEDIYMTLQRDGVSHLGRWKSSSDGKGCLCMLSCHGISAKESSEL
jgi:hypothetical protein